jgi:hypothetical protein
VTIPKSIHINNPLVSEGFDQLAEQKVTEGLPGNGSGVGFQKGSLRHKRDRQGSDAGRGLPTACLAATFKDNSPSGVLATATG